jgi:hypothetical protein
LSVDPDAAVPPPHAARIKPAAMRRPKRNQARVGDRLSVALLFMRRSFDAFYRNRAIDASNTQSVCKVLCPEI